jgi:acyl carrier protein
MDTLAHHRRSRGLTALSVNWGSWAEVGMAVEFDGGERAAAPGGLGAIAPKQGLEALEKLLSRGVAQAAVMPVNWAQWRRLYPGFASSPLLSELSADVGAAPTDASTRSEPALWPLVDRQALFAAESSERRRMLTDYLRARVASVLGIDEASFDPEQPVSRLGFDSLMAVELKNRIETDLGAVIPMVRFLQGSSVVNLAASLLEELSGLDAAQGQSVAAGRESVASAAGWEEGEL